MGGLVMTYKDFYRIAKEISESYGSCLTERELKAYARTYASEYKYHSGNISKSVILSDVMQQYNDLKN